MTGPACWFHTPDGEVWRVNRQWEFRPSEAWRQVEAIGGSLGEWFVERYGSLPEMPIDPDVQRLIDLKYPKP